MKPLAALVWFCALAWPQAPAEGPALKPGLYAILETGEGTITAKLFEKDTPVAVQNFVALAQGVKAWREPKSGGLVKRPLYNNITFHRVLTGEMIQAGDPTGTGSHNCGIRIRDEFLPGLRFNAAGRLAVANTGQPDSGGCQFFITDGPVPRWNDKYTIFGEVVSGQPVVSKISHAPTRAEKPDNPVKLITVTIQRVGPEPKHKIKNQ